MSGPYACARRGPRARTAPKAAPPPRAMGNRFPSENSLYVLLAAAETNSATTD